jgi:hypothetical protein
VADETRTLTTEERALFDWFFDQWPELGALQPALDFDVPAEVFVLAEDGYTTLSVPYLANAERVSVPSPYPGEARADIDGHPFEALFFAGDDMAMLELIWSAGTWPGRLPRPDELRSY